MRPVYGPEILARYLSRVGPPDKYGVQWQYHSRSDRHSKVGCWGVALDLLRTSALLRSHAEDGKVVLGVNHEMRDFATGRKKDLDLVLARPGVGKRSGVGTFKQLAHEYDLPLTPAEQAELRGLPDIDIAGVGAVLVALEAKACMTAHVKALPRLYDELNSSHLCVHGASAQALAIGYVQVNVSDEFISPVLNSRAISQGLAPEVTSHRQPDVTRRVIKKVEEIPRRSSNSGVGFDAIGLSVFDLRNDGSPVTLVSSPPAPGQGDAFDYGTMITRMANEYDAVFARI